VGGVGGWGCVSRQAKEDVHREASVAVLVFVTVVVVVAHVEGPMHRVATARMAGIVTLATPWAEGNQVEA
jgi:hypothetical protein